jgi:FtsP/CotA-like multicopper oxidase with cupredoxin domain
MHASNTNTRVAQLLRVATVSVAALLAQAAQAAAPGIIGRASLGTTAGTSTFNLVATAAHISQPDGQAVYSWGYGCTTAPSGFLPAPGGVNIPGAACSTMQIPGPTLIVNQGDTVTVTLTNNLPAAAGNTSILFPGFTLTSTTGGSAGLLTQEAAPSGGTVSYTFTASTPGTHSYYSGTQGDLQVEMGLYGAIIVLPATIPTACNTSTSAPSSGPNNLAAQAAHSEKNFRLAAAAYNHAMACYDREYLFQFSEMDPRIHRQVEEQVLAGATQLAVDIDPYRPAYFMINGRSMPDDMDPNYAAPYPHQPYNGNPHMHPGELVLLRIIGQGRWQHPFHEHGNHVRVLARDGNLLLTPTTTAATATTPLAGPLLFTTTTTPGQAIDGIFYWTGKGLNWDVFGHGFVGDDSACVADVNGYYTSNRAAVNYYEWCPDHRKPLESKPFGSVASGGPMTLPDPNIVANGPWYSGSPYLGGEATRRAIGTTPIPPSGTVANSPTDEAGFAYMWHSHNEREITTNNIFPGGMMMMMLVDPRAYVIDESK